MNEIYGSICPIRQGTDDSAGASGIASGKAERKSAAAQLLVQLKEMEIVEARRSIAAGLQKTSRASKKAILSTEKGECTPGHR